MDHIDDTELERSDRVHRSKIFEEEKQKLAIRQKHYQQVLNEESPIVQLVLMDLKRFCRGDESAFHPNDRVNALLQGRQEVWLRIMDHLKLSMDDLALKYIEGVRNATRRSTDIDSAH